MKTANKSALRRISLKAKVIIVMILLVLASLGVVAAFAIGFVTGSMLARTGQDDQCANLKGNWNGEVCVVVPPAPQPVTPTTKTVGYRCGNGSAFTLEETSSTTRQFRMGAQDARSLNIVSDDVMTRFEDAEVSLVLDGPDARLRDRMTGEIVSCTAQTP